MKYVIFDFNGTVVDDLDLSLACINRTIEKYLDRGPLSKEEYYEVFTFPIKRYYEKAGFNFDELCWEEVGQTWMDYYIENRKDTRVHNGIIEFLVKNHEKGNRNIILSASKMQNLTDHLKELGIYEYFDEILGIDNIYASSKLQIGLDFVKDKNREDCIMIGDSIHDYEVAKEMGIKCYLIPKGHQNKETLLKTGAVVVDDISEVMI